MALSRALLTLVVFVAMFSVGMCQFFDYFGGPQASNLVAAGGSQPTRDPRGNTGPVVFPPSSPGSETSGVRVGASGYGFVPPQAPRGHGPFAGYQSW